MVTLKKNRPVTTTKPVIEVDGNLPVGRHRIELVAIDNAGQQSKPAAVNIVILKKRTGRIVNPNDRLREHVVVNDAIRGRLRDRIIVPPRR